MRTMKTILIWLIMPLAVRAADLDRNDKINSLTANAKLSATLDSLISAPFLRHSHVGAAVYSPMTQTIVYTRNAAQAFLPASTMKLFTTATALQTMGADFQFQTRMFMRGRTFDGVFTGDIIIKGDGDPTLTWHEGGPDSSGFNRFAAQLKRHGIRQIKGRLIGDDNVFDEQSLGWGWGWENELNSFAAPIGGLTINRNCMSIIVIPGKAAGDKGIVRLLPAIRDAAIDNRCITVADSLPAGFQIDRSRGSDRITLIGQLPLSYLGEQRSIPVLNPTMYTLQVLRCAIERAEITVSSDLYDIDDLPGYNYPLYAPVFTCLSDPLSEIVYDINKNSNNLAAESLLKAVGYAVYGTGSAESGATAIESWGRKNNIPMEGIAIVDGSGLSRKSAITPEAFIRLLTVMRSDSAFYASLPISGRDGTLAHRLSDVTCRGRIHAKTGTLEGVHALSGYAESENGEEWIFCLTINQAPATPGRVYELMNKFCYYLIKNEAF
jgi:serine-type D-Ala-D-Ala carboxypeptidase/endopeptidase (penicillin-binding protein 4)